MEDAQYGKKYLLEFMEFVHLQQRLNRKHWLKMLKGFLDGAADKKSEVEPSFFERVKLSPRFLSPLPPSYGCSTSSKETREDYKS